VSPLSLLCYRSGVALTPPSSGRLPACFARLQPPLMSNVRLLLVNQHHCISSRVQSVPRAAVRTGARARGAVGCLRGAELRLFGGQRSIGLAARGPSAHRCEGAKRCRGPAPVLWLLQCSCAQGLVLRRRLRSAHARGASARGRGVEAAPGCGKRQTRAWSAQCLPFACCGSCTKRRAVCEG
jgi:hypothetical protein